MSFGINADFDTVPGLDIFREGIESELTELCELAARASAPAGPLIVASY